MDTPLKCQWRLTTSRRVLLVLIALLIVLHGEPEPTAASTRWSDSDAEQVSEAIGLFQRRGLQPPPVTIEFHDDVEPCKGHPGYFRPRLDRIDICSDLPFVLIHELAHVWIEDNMGVAARLSFVQRSSLPTWNDHNYEWDQRGVELAAFTIQQVVMRDLDPNRSRNRELLADFAFLTRAGSPSRGRF